MVTLLREADRSTVAEAAKKHKVSEPTIYAWRKHFGQRGPLISRSSRLSSSRTPV
jgi:transposase-like protein